MGQWNRELIELLPTSMQVMASAGAGFDWVDTGVLAEFGVYMCIHLCKCWQPHDLCMIVDPVHQCKTHRQEMTPTPRTSETYTSHSIPRASFADTFSLWIQAFSIAMAHTPPPNPSPTWPSTISSPFSAT